MRKTAWHASNDSIRITQENLEELRLAVIDMATLTLRASLALTSSPAQVRDAQKILDTLETARSYLRRIDIELTNVGVAAGNTIVRVLAKGGKISADNERHEHRPDSSRPTSAATQPRRAGQRD